jgi:N-methylhydantoinase A/oxoprolinase/acetone carboxylase beta subunit
MGRLDEARATVTRLRAITPLVVPNDMGGTSFDLSLIAAGQPAIPFHTACSPRANSEPMINLKTLATRCSASRHNAARARSA